MAAATDRGLQVPQNGDRCLVIFPAGQFAVVFSQTVKDAFFEQFSGVMIIDSIGSSEIGGGGILMAAKGQIMRGGPTVTPGQGATVLDLDTLEALQPGSEKEGVVARTGFIPLGYYKDPLKTSETFVTAADGKRLCSQWRFGDI